MLINPNEVVTGALVNAIAVVGRQISKAAAGLRGTDEDVTTARWFETFRLTGTPPDVPGLSPVYRERLAVVLGGVEVQAALQELLAVRLTDAPETDASQAREAVRVAVVAAEPDAAGFAGVLAGYYDDQISALVARLEAEEPPMLVQIRSEAFSARMISVMHAIERHTAALTEDERQSPDVRAAGRLLTEVTNPFALEVHRPVQVDGQPPGLSALPTYVSREHDQELAEVVQAAANEGASGLAVLVGGSSTGKTRACWEALRLLRERSESWRLWHPIDPSRPEAALRELPSIGPRTVIWLNEAQFYLDVKVDGLGEQVAAGLRELLRDPARAPVLVLATLWPQYWDALTARPAPREADPHAQARELLVGQDISVPGAFTAYQMRLLPAAGDPRLARAAEAAEDGQVIQFLAGVPELMARYRNSPPAAAALIDAAIDARRLGTGVALPLAFLEQAAPLYLTDTDWDRLGEDWLGQALAYTTTPCNGIRGPLTRIRSRAVGGTVPAAGPIYRLADYLEQHGRRARRHMPPSGFWDAAARFASPSDLPALASAAANRGLLRDAARLRKRAAAQGDTGQAAILFRQLHFLHPADPRPAQWMAAHAALDHPGDVGWLLDLLQRAGAQEEAAALVARNPAAHVSLDDPDDVTWLLRALRKAGAALQVAALAARDPAAHADLDNRTGVFRLLDTMWAAGLEEQVAALAGRAALVDPYPVTMLMRIWRAKGATELAASLADLAATRAPLDNPGDVVRVLEALLKAGAAEQAAALIARDPAAHASLTDPDAVARLLEALLKAGAAEQAAALADRAAAHAPLDNPGDVAGVLEALLKAGAAEQAAALAGRAAAHASVTDPDAVARLLKALLKAGAAELAASLADLAAAHAPLDNPGGVAAMLEALLKAGAAEQAAALIARDPAAHASLTDPDAVARLLEALLKAGAAEQAAALIARDPAAHASLTDPDAVARLLKALLKAGAAEQAAALADRAAAHASVTDPDAVARLLKALLKAGAAEQAAALADRAAAHAPLDNPGGVAAMLEALLKAGAAEQAAALIARDPAAHVSLTDPDAVARLLEALLKAGAAEQAAALIARDPAAHTFLDRPGAARLLAALRKADAAEQAKTLVARLPAEGEFGLFDAQADHEMHYRFGREPDGSPASSWGWDDLD
jgi:uncharacterized protein YidB (DUF937 family)